MCITRIIIMSNKSDIDYIRNNINVFKKWDDFFIVGDVENGEIKLIHQSLVNYLHEFKFIGSSKDLIKVVLWTGNLF